MAATVQRLREATPATHVELLIGDLGGSAPALEQVVRQPPDVLAHNIETVRRLSPSVRDRRASYEGSRLLLRRARSLAGRELVLKSSIMLGLGETPEEVRQTMRDLREDGVDLLTFGQYLRPSPAHLPVQQYVPPDEFESWKIEALATGFSGCEAGPLVRSSYHAEELFRNARAARGG
jgi:lipoic acid synthetase